MVTGINQEEALRQRPVHYQKTHSFSGPYINDVHRDLANMPLKDGTVQIDHPIRGSLRREDAAKIYELAYFANGPVADVGTNWGLSAAIAARALTDAGTPFCVQTVDIDPKMRQRAIANFTKHTIENIVPHVCEAAAWLDAQCTDGNRFHFVFVDHSHEYAPVKNVCRQLADVMVEGGFVAFHDFYDKRNAGPEDEFAVVQGVMDGLDNTFRFCGASGCIAVFRLIPGG
jgi:predicted O-methyltransferase YrrM